jgi:ethanolamine utilization protein EutQ (cupin superfamily)
MGVFGVQKIGGLHIFYLSEQNAMFAIENQKLKKNLKAKAGQTINCPQCRKKHKLRSGQIKSARQSEWKTSTFALFYKCGSRVMLGAVNGKLITSEISEKILNH